LYGVSDEEGDGGLLALDALLGDHIRLARVFQVTPQLADFFTETLGHNELSKVLEWLS